MSERASRVDRLLDELGEPGLDLMLVTELLNVRYLTGFTGSNGLALVGSNLRAFVTDFRYDEQATAEVEPSFERRIGREELADELDALLPPGALRLGFEDFALTVRAHAELREKLPARVELVAAGRLVERLRAVKEPDEIARIGAAAELADAALREIMEQGLAGRTERAVALALADGMRRRGAQEQSFDTIVAAGAQGARPHAVPRDATIPRGELVVVDWGAKLDGYCSDCTRTLATGDLSDEARLVYDLVHEAQRAGLAAVRAGAETRAVDSAARELIAAAGHGERFGHSLGHSVGLEVHERPTLSQRSDETLGVGNVVTVEPGVYLPGSFGVRIEDLCAITDSGVEILTGIPKELVTVG